MRIKNEQEKDITVKLYANFGSISSDSSVYKIPKNKILDTIWCDIHYIKQAHEGLIDLTVVNDTLKKIVLGMYQNVMDRNTISCTIFKDKIDVQEPLR